MSDIYGMMVHPAAELFPMLAADELAELAEDIRTQGLHEPLWVWEDPERGPVILDGRNRLAACKLAGVRPVTRTYTGDDPVSFVISENVRRRHLTAMQKAGIAAKALPLYEAQTKASEARRKRLEIEGQRNKTTAGLPESSSDNGQSSRRAPTSSDKAAAKVGVSGRSVQQYKRIQKHASDLLPMVDSGELSGERAEQIIRDRMNGGSKEEKPVSTPTRKRRPLPTAAKEAAARMRKEIEKLERLFADDRYHQNREQVATLTRGHLSYTVETAQRLLDVLNKESSNE